MRSPWGRVVRSIREDEDVASSLGKPVFGYKLQVLVLGGVIAGLGGIMLALGNSTVNANTFQPQVTFFTYAVLIIGGAATRLGPIVGAMLFWFIFAGAQSLLEQMDKHGYLPGFLEGGEARGALATALIGVLIMAVMALRPQGIFGRRSEMALDG
jgi:branched-chain amino acid transport system permease protein